VQGAVRERRSARASVRRGGPGIASFVVVVAAAGTTALTAVFMAIS
jgi:hypothetical protein